MATGSALTLRHVSPRPPVSISRSPSPSFSSFLHPLPKRRPRSSLAASNSRLPMPPVGFNDPFVSGLNAADSFDFWPKLRKGPDFSPSLDVVASSSFAPSRPRESLEVKLPPAHVDESRLATEAPPDPESHLLYARIVYVYLPLVPVVSELIIAQLLYLQGMNPYEPIYMYIHSTGTANDDGEPIALETEGFAVYDTMMSLQNEVHTVLVGPAAGHACLLLAAGTKGKRYMFPGARALIQQPRMPSYGEMPTSDLVIRTREALIQRNKLAELIGKHTGNSFEKVEKLMRAPFYMDFDKAKEFGLVDKMSAEKEMLMADVPSQAEWDIRAGIAEARED
ncbi:ATP-dependent Clp protease proteolytic subunit [Rhynchospora pubera]|uniref:ATP-dependent Clp protease proteolytic subunit n=1 Tax=Rhynchospora pubera TaxID=906938 RepID=A0AAV8HQY1_9POAL|nr:ATP-dependent Clp protease proteolytic subunit [Rhynchospora pubera]